MNYKLAKKLKDAEFPLNIDKLIKARVHPTLSELIDACGDVDFGFHRSGNKKWQAWVRIAKISGKIKQEIEANGETPEIAVAKLWLKLNAKTA